LRPLVIEAEDYGYHVYCNYYDGGIFGHSGDLEKKTQINISGNVAYHFGYRWGGFGALSCDEIV